MKDIAQSVLLALSGYKRFTDYEPREAGVTCRGETSLVCIFMLRHSSLSIDLCIVSWTSMTFLDFDLDVVHC